MGNLNVVLREASQELKPADVRAHELSCLKILQLYFVTFSMLI